MRVFSLALPARGKGQYNRWEMDHLSEIGRWLVFAGLGLAVWTVKLFVNFGDGTPAPWDPPKKLVIRGPYRHVRNPMITGAVLMLLAEAMLFQSWPISLWMVIFFMGNAIYFPLVEEKGLEKRFGDSYRKYKAHVPRWIPRLRPWNQHND